jgi:hypothetical protein
MKASQRGPLSVAVLVSVAHAAFRGGDAATGRMARDRALALEPENAAARALPRD